MRFSIVVPCYNEAKNIPTVLERFAAGAAGRDFELVLVNNGSKDNSADVMGALLPQYPFARVVHVPVNQGYGFGILAGLKAASGEIMGWTHADQQTDPMDCFRAFELIMKDGAAPGTFVKGRRCGRPWSDEFFTAAMGLFETVYFRTALWDINAQPNVFHRSFYEAWVSAPYDFSLDLFAAWMTAQKKLKVIRFPVLFPKRVHGVSHWNTGLASKWKFIRRTLEYSVSLKKRVSV